MRFLHTADWHIGKRLHGFSLAEEQAAAFASLRAIAQAEKVDAIVLAGDLYDRSLPASESVVMLNQQLQMLNLTDELPILGISGNHDSAARLGSGAPWYQNHNFFLSTTIAESLTPLEYPEVQFYLLPYFEIFQVQQLFPEAKLPDLAAAFALLAEKMQASFNPQKKHVLVSHFFAAGASTSDSETKVQVGGLQAIPVDQLEIFDYVALGHLHNPQALQHPRIRYSGSLLPFSLSETNQQKGVVLVDVTAAGVTCEFVPIEPLHPVVELTASFDDLRFNQEYLQHQEDFVGICLTDTKVIPNVMTELRKIYPRLLKIERQQASGQQLPQVQTHFIQGNPLGVFAEYFQQVTTEKMTPQQEMILQKATSQLEEK